MIPLTEVISSTIYLVLVVAALYQILFSMRLLGNSSLRTLLGYFFVGTVLLAGIRVLFFLADTKILDINDTTLMVLWHMLFYIAVLTWLFAGKAMASLANISSGKSSLVSAVLWGIVSVGSMLYVFAHVTAWNYAISTQFSGTIWDRTGSLHFIAFLFAGGVAYFLFAIRKRFSTSLGVIVGPHLLVVILLSLIHLWELLGESWHVLPVSEAFGEHVEQLLWIPVYAGVAYGYWKLRRMLSSSTG